MTIINPFFFWVIGAFIGVHIIEKTSNFRLPKIVQRALLFLTLISIPFILKNINKQISFNFHPGVTVAKTNTHSLGSVITAPAFEELTRLRQDDVKRAKAVQEKALRLQKTAAIEQAKLVLADVKLRRALASAATITNSESDLIAGRLAKVSQKGPFCHIQCAVHHGDLYDRETNPEFCKANWIPPTAQYVPGWYLDQETDEYEVLNPWPGPATPGFHTYHLYWKDTHN